MPFVYSIKCKLEPYMEYIGQTAHEDFQVRHEKREQMGAIYVKCVKENARLQEGFTGSLSRRKMFRRTNL